MKYRKKQVSDSHTLPSPNILQWGHTGIHTQREMNFASSDKYGKIMAKVLEEK